MYDRNKWQGFGRVECLLGAGSASEFDDMSQFLVTTACEALMSGAFSVAESVI